MAALLDLPHDLLIQDILFRLPWPTVAQCCLVCKSLQSAIASSPLLVYQQELFRASMVDNPKSTLSLPTKLEMLKERERRWLHLEPKTIIEQKHAGRGEWLSVAAEDGAIIFSVLRAGHIHLAMFPSLLGSQDVPVRMSWNDISFPDQEEPAIGFCTALDESDLIAVGFKSVVSLHSIKL